MNAIDYAILVVLLISVGVGIFRGAIREVFNIAGWVMAFVLAHSYAGVLAPQFGEWASEPVLRLVSAWLIIFLVVLAATSLIASLLSGVAKKIGLGGVDRGIGAAIGLLRGGLVLVGLTLAIGLTKFPQAGMWQAATFTPWLEVAALYSRNMLPESVAARIRYRVPVPNVTTSMVTTSTLSGELRRRSLQSR
jgi:membrane protein required for colicin V production